MVSPDARATHRVIDRDGERATLTNYEQTGEDDYGTVWTETAASPTDIQVLPGTRRQPAPERTAYEAGEVAVDAVYLAKDTVAGIRDGGGEGASRLAVSGKTYVVLDAVDRRGATQLYCVRED
jgi:hypothetical protein